MTKEDYYKVKKIYKKFIKVLNKIFNKEDVKSLYSLEMLILIYYN